MNAFWRWAVTCGLMALLSWQADAQQAVLAEKGEWRACIVTPRKAAPAEIRAAAELGRYLGMIVGVAPAAPSPDPVPGCLPIHVGHTDAARRELSDDELPSSEGFLIAIQPERIVIAGVTPRGTLYGVYRFLETSCGCFWLAPGIDDVPTDPDLSVSAGRGVSAPDFTMRLFNARTESLMDWGIKVGMNGYYTQKTRNFHGNGYYMPDALPGCHTYHRVIPAETYADSHPEWWPFLSGERQPTRLHGKQLCVTAPGLADEFAGNISALFDADPDCNLTSISPNDGSGWCDCDRCLGLDERLCGGRVTVQGLAGEKPFRGDRVFWFANEVARRVAVDHPDKLLLVLAYVNYAEPPDTVVPRRNVVPYLCHYAPADYSRPIHDPSSEPNAQFNRLLTAWADRAPHLLFYSYVSKSMWWRLPRPILPNFSADIRYLHELGIRRYYCQSRLADWALDGPLYYVLARLMWDIDADPGAVAEMWTRRMFGPSAPAVSRFYDLVNRAAHVNPKPFSDNPPRDIPGLFDESLLDEAEAALRRAATLAGEAEPYAERVAAVASVFRYGRLVIRGLEAEEHFTRSGDVEAAEQTITYLKAALKVYNRPEVRKHLNQLRLSALMGVVARGFGEVENKGGREAWNTDETGVGDQRAGWATVTVPIPKATSGFRLILDVWGTSNLASVAVNTGGQGRSYSAGGIWTPVPGSPTLNGKQEWNRLEFRVSADMLPKDREAVIVGMGGGDSQIWISNVEVHPLDD